MPNFWATLVRKIWSRVFSKFAQSGHTECVSVSFIMLFITFRQNKRVRDVHSIWLEDDDDAATIKRAKQKWTKNYGKILMSYFRHKMSFRLKICTDKMKITESLEVGANRST